MDNNVFLRKLVTQQQIAAAKQRGLVPQSGNWQAPLRWIRGDSQQQQQQVPTTAPSSIKEQQQSSPATGSGDGEQSQERRQALLDSISSTSASDSFWRNKSLQNAQKEGQDARGRSVFEGVYGQNIDLVVGLSNVHAGRHDSKFNNVESKHIDIYNKKLGIYQKLNDQIEDLEQKYSQVDSKYRYFEQNPDKSSPPEQEKLRRERDKVQAAYTKAILKRENYAPGRLILEKWDSIRKDLKKDFAAQLKEDKNYSSSQQKEIVKNYESLLSKTAFESHNRVNIEGMENLKSVNTNLDWMLRNVSQLLPRNFYAGVGKISAGEHMHHDHDYMHFRQSAIGEIDLSPAALNSPRQNTYNTYALIHEIGHSVHLNMLKRYPEAFAGLSESPEKLEKNSELYNMNTKLFSDAQGGGSKFYTNYSSTNEMEFFAENFAGYFGSGVVKARPEAEQSLAYSNMDVFKYMALVEETLNKEENINAYSPIESKFADERYINLKRSLAVYD